MITKGVRYLHHVRILQRMNLSLNRASASAALREIDPHMPATWEFTGFSQHGEDGVFDYLTRKITSPNRYFIEIGASNGVENNSTWLALARSYSGLMIDGNLQSIEWCRHLLQWIKGESTPSSSTRHPSRRSLSRISKARTFVPTDPMCARMGRTGDNTSRESSTSKWSRSEPSPNERENYFCIHELPWHVSLPTRFHLAGRARPAAFRAREPVE